MIREIINENYHLKVFNRDLKGKTANSKNPKYEVGVLTEDGSYKIIGLCMTLSQGYWIMRDYIDQHESKNFISRADEYYLIESLGFTLSEVDSIYEICKARDKTVRELLSGFLRELK